MTSYNVKLGIKLCYKLEYVDCSSDAVISNAIFDKIVESKNEQNEITHDIGCFQARVSIYDLVLLNICHFYHHHHTIL